MSVLDTTLSFSESVQAIGSNVLVMSLVCIAAILAYSYRSTKGRFDFGCWLRTNRDRFIAGGIFIFTLSILKVVSPDISALLQLLGVAANGTPVILGLGIATFLISGVSGNHTKPIKKINTEDNL